MSRIISDVTDEWGNRIVVFEDEFGDVYETLYYADGGESTRWVE